MRDAYPQGMLLYYVSFTYSFAHGGCATMRKPHRSNMKFRLIFPHFGTTIIFDFFDLYLACVQCEYAARIRICMLHISDSFSNVYALPILV